MAKENTLEQKMASALKGIPGAGAIANAGIDSICRLLCQGKRVELGPYQLSQDQRDELGPRGFDIHHSLDEFNEGIAYIKEQVALSGYLPKNTPFDTEVVMTFEDSRGVYNDVVSLYFTIQRK